MCMGSNLASSASTGRPQSVIRGPVATAPIHALPAEADAPKCCGVPMQRAGNKFACRNCGEDTSDE